MDDLTRAQQQKQALGRPAVLLSAGGRGQAGWFPCLSHCHSPIPQWNIRPQGRIVINLPDPFPAGFPEGREGSHRGFRDAVCIWKSDFAL